MSDSETLLTVAHLAPLSFTVSQSLLRFTSIEAVMLSNHLILCHPLLLLPLIFPSIRVFSNESPLHIRWPTYWSFSFSINPMNIQNWFPLGLTGLISLLSKGLSRVFSNTRIRKHQFFSALPSLLSSSHIHTWLLGTQLRGHNNSWLSHWGGIRISGELLKNVSFFTLPPRFWFCHSSFFIVIKYTEWKIDHFNHF